jgi:hypothetical protein
MAAVIPGMGLGLAVRKGFGTLALALRTNPHIRRLGVGQHHAFEFV